MTASRNLPTGDVDTSCSPSDYATGSWFPTLFPPSQKYPEDAAFHQSPVSMPNHASTDKLRRTTV